MNVIDPTQPCAPPHGNHLLIFSHASLKTVGTVFVFSPFSPRFLPLLVKFRPCFARFEPSDVYGAVPSATALVDAYLAGHYLLRTLDICVYNRK
jgi:hypothetical protein